MRSYKFPTIPQPPAKNKNDRAKSTAKNGSFFQNESDFIAKTGQNHKNIHYFEKILRKSFVISKIVSNFVAK